MDDEQSLLEIKNVDAILSYGKIWSSRIGDILVAFFVILEIMILVVSSIGMIAAHGMMDAQKAEDLFFVAIMGYITGGVTFLASMLIAWIIFHGRRKAKLYLQDAVLLKARVESLDTQIEVRYPAIIMNSMAICVRFRYQGRKIVKESAYKGARSYSVIFKKYADREIKIAYSPKYDEVLFLKSF